MKNILTIAAAVIITAMPLKAQNCEVGASLVIPQESNLTPSAAELFSSRVGQLTSDAGIMRIDGSNFVIVPKIVAISKNVLPGPPVKVSQEFEFTLYMVDLNNSNIYASHTFTLRGIGENESKSQIAALKQIKGNNEAVKTFMNDAKAKAVKYYDDNYAAIIKKAEGYAALKNYDQALFTLLSVPVCSKGYDKAFEAAKNTYQAYIDEMCRINLANARTAWFSKQSAEGAEEAGRYLSQILPDAGCYQDAVKLYEEIKSRVDEDLRFEMKKYDDAVNLESKRIEAMKQIGVAYGKGQQPSTTNILGLR